MQVIFTKDVAGIAKKGDLKSVKEGYFQNFLLPRGLALMATESKIKEAEAFKKKQLMEKEMIREQAADLKKKLDGHKIVIKHKAKGEKLYGSITEKEISALITKDFKIKLDKDHLKINHIKKIGTYEIVVNLAEGISAKLSVEVKSE